MCFVSTLWAVRSKNKFTPINTPHLNLSNEFLMKCTNVYFIFFEFFLFKKKKKNVWRNVSFTWLFVIVLSVFSMSYISHNILLFFCCHFVKQFKFDRSPLFSQPRTSAHLNRSQNWLKLFFLSRPLGARHFFVLLPSARLFFLRKVILNRHIFPSSAVIVRRSEKNPETIRRIFRHSFPKLPN